MTRSRIEGLLSAFPKLITTGKQHTFVETESVRYVYQAIEKLYIVLITTKNSNILEDLETLRLFAKVIPEYSHSVDEMGIAENAFNLIFAFDEIVALGYRESVNPQMIRGFIEMDSHEEKVQLAVRQSQEREAKAEMKKKVKEMDTRRKEMERGRRGMSGYGGNMGSFGRQFDSSSGVVPVLADSIPAEQPKYSLNNSSSRITTNTTGINKAMKLGSKRGNVDSFVDQLKNEGEDIRAAVINDRNRPLEAPVVPPSRVQIENVHLRIEEKLSVVLNRDGGVESFDLHGMMYNKVFEDRFNRVAIYLKNHLRSAHPQPHPNIDKQKFLNEHVITLRNPDKPFPVNTDIGVLKWRLQSQDDTYVPFTINCWPNDSGSSCEVNVEYELLNPKLELREVQIEIPIPSNAGAPVVSEIDGSHQFESRRGSLFWRLEVIDEHSSTGNLVFTTASANPENFFPIKVSFYSPKIISDISIDRVIQSYGDEMSLKYSTESSLVVEKYEIV